MQHTYMLRIMENSINIFSLTHILGIALNGERSFEFLASRLNIIKHRGFGAGQKIRAIVLGAGFS
jgi:hypothetical protein